MLGNQTIHQPLDLNLPRKNFVTFRNNVFLQYGMYSLIPKISRQVVRIGKTLFSLKMIPQQAFL